MQFRKSKNDGFQPKRKKRNLYCLLWDTRPGLDCYMISDNLRIHTNVEVVATALRSGIHMINIMPGSSHWFQVHDQHPFATLKNVMEGKKYELLSDTPLTPEDRRVLLVGLFIKLSPLHSVPELCRSPSLMWDCGHGILQGYSKHVKATLHPRNSTMLTIGL